jgi:GAF domain-containing protein
VLDVIAQHAARLSGSDDAVIGLRDGEKLIVAAHHGDIPMIPIGQGIGFNRESVAGRAMIDGRPLQAIHGTVGTDPEFPEGDAVAAQYGYRVTCAVPLIREGEVIGMIGIRRIKPELLNESQIAVIQSFASQAAIAIGNVHLFDETVRLLKETEARNTELAVINSIQQGLASHLELQGIIDLVGDKVREVFTADVVGIALLDRARDFAVVSLPSRPRPALPRGTDPEREHDRYRRRGPSYAANDRVPQTKSSSPFGRTMASSTGSSAARR